jgi:tetrahydromethanopterin S-methyltransferase subunit B
MTIALSDNDPRVSYTVAEGVTQTAFTVTFEFFDDADLNFYVDGTLKTLTTHYTVTGGSGATGTINTTAGNSVTGIAGGSTVVITREIALARTTDFPSSGAFQVATLNTELDRFTAIAADILDDTTRSIQLADSDAAASMTLPLKADRVGKVLGFNATTGAVEAGPTIADVSSLAQITTDISTLADIEDGTDATDAIQTVAGISGNVTTVAGISANVTTVAGITANIASVVADEADIGTVATNISSVNTVATNIADVITVANDLNEAVSELETVANDLNEATSEIDTVANSISNVDIVGANIANVNTVGGISANVTTVAGVSANVTTVAGISGNVSTVAGISSDVTAVAGDATDIGTVSTNIANVNIVAGNNTNVSTVAGISGNVTTVAGIQANVTTVAGISGNVTTVANDATDIGTVATNIANVNSVGGSIANVNTVASNLASVNNFAEVYRIESSAPTTSLDLGDLYFDTTSDTLKVYGASGWQNAGSSINGTSQRYHYDISGTPTSVTGADANGNTLTYDAGYVDVYVNGVRMSTADVTVTSGDTVTFTEALADGDEVDIVGYGTFSVASLNADNLDSGTVPDARITGAYTGITNLTMSGNLTVDTNTLVVNSSTNSVGIGTSSPYTLLELSSTDPILRFNDSNGGTDTKNFEIRYVGTSSPDIDGLYFRTANDANSVYSDKMVVLGNGNVGIGTSSPVSDARLTISSDNTESNIFLERSGSGRFDVAIANTSGSLVFKGGSNQTTVAGLTEFMKINGDTGAVTKPLQPCFSAGASYTNIPLTTTTKVTLVSERFDVGSNLDLLNDTFTAPVTGKYLFTYIFYFSSLDADHTTLDATIKTSNTQYQQTVKPSAFLNADANFSLTGSMICDMDASDTFHMNVYVSAGSAQTDIHPDSHVSGVLIC